MRRGAGKAGSGARVRRNSPEKAYGDDLAYIHDVGYGDFARNSAPGLLKILKRNGITEGLIVDLGCGSGIWARALCDAGYDALGIDYSQAMVRLAKKHVPRARFLAGSFLEIKLPSCDAVTSLGECFNYQSDARNDPVRLSGLFHRIYGSLKPGGLFIFDVAAPGRGRGPRLRHFEGIDWVILLEVDEDQKNRRLTRSITTFRKMGRLYRRNQEIHRLRLYDRFAIAGELRRIGFSVRTLRSYGRQRLPNGCFGFLARKS